MKKFHDVYKEKQNRALEVFENKVLTDFKNVYGTLLDKYNTSDFYTLNEEQQDTFTAELNSFWTEESGLTEKGSKFLQIKSDVLSESSTTLQKRNFLKDKAVKIINETLRQSDMKWKLYDIIDEMYSEIDASNLGDILSPESITKVIKESFETTLSKFVKEINHELNESAKEVDSLNEKKKSQGEGKK